MVTLGEKNIAWDRSSGCFVGLLLRGQSVPWWGADLSGACDKNGGLFWQRHPGSVFSHRARQTPTETSRKNDMSLKTPINAENAAVWKRGNQSNADLIEAEVSNKSEMFALRLVLFSRVNVSVCDAGRARSCCCPTLSFHVAFPTNSLLCVCTLLCCLSHSCCVWHCCGMKILFWSLL